METDMFFLDHRKPLRMKEFGKPEDQVRLASFGPES